MNELIWVVSRTEYFKELGIDVTYNRKTHDQELMMMHIEHLSDDQILFLVKKGETYSLRHKLIDKLMQTPEWGHDDGEI